MCVGIKLEDPPLRRDQQNFENYKSGAAKEKTRNNDERKVKAKDAARCRRTQESEYFEELEKLLLVTGPPPSSQQTTLDKTSVIRLSVAHLKSQDVLKNGLQMTHVKEELFPDIDLFSCLDGFSLVIGFGGDIIYVSENVGQYIGLTQVELLGQEFSDYIHPCDHHMLKLLTPGKTAGPEDENVEIFVRVKCTVTERGRMINLKQANYKPLKISGKARRMPENEACGVTGTVFLGVARSVVEREVDKQIGVFTTKHSVDMKFVETNQWMSSIASYSPETVLGLSFFDLVHAQDIGNIQKAFLILKEHGQCETSPYRLLCYGGGYAWVQTKACLGSIRRGSSKGQTISCSHQQISEVMNRDEILSLVQMNNKTITAPSHTQAMKNKVPKEEYENVEDKISYFERKASNIVPQQRKNNNHQSFGFDQNIASSSPTVIVKCHKPDRPVASSTLQKPDESFEEEEVQTTNLVIKGNRTIATESLFGKTEAKQASSQTSSDITKQFLAIKNLQNEDGIDLKENDFFDELFSNLGDLEKLAPYSGAQCITLKKTDAVTEKPVNFEDLILLDFEDDSKFAKSIDELLVGKQNGVNATEFEKFMQPIVKLTFDQNPVLIDPNTDTVMESNNHKSHGRREYCDKYNESRTRPHTILREDERLKRESTKRIPVIIQNESGLKLQGQKLEFNRNQHGGITETLGDRKSFWPEKDNSGTNTEHLAKQNVKCFLPETEVSLQRFQKHGTFVEKGGIKPKSVTESLFWANNDSITRTKEWMCSKKVPSYSSSVSSSRPIQNVVSIANLYPEESTFGDIISNLDGLELFAPHSGDQCIELNKKESKTDKPTIETFNFEDMIFLNFDNDSEFSKENVDFMGGKRNENIASEFERLMKPIEKLTFDQEQVLIDPDRNTMWGSNNFDDVENNETWEIFQPNKGRANVVETCRKRYPTIINHRSGMKPTGAKADFYRNQEEYHFEPQGGKVVVHPQKRVADPNEVEQYCLKKIKFNLEKYGSVAPIIQQFEYINNFDARTDDIEIVTIN
eukprot:GFUD01000936.1.p1 GENE.GFUD01000936.1~~GFUD01000936.1.p1  ORF type:complete len:1030 (+),score=208.67 GFUD01000936.1:83-3172(+)